MSRRSLFLSNAELTIDEIEVAHSTAMGRRAGEAEAGPGNSGFMLVTALGDAGDGLDHSVQLRGNKHFQRYFPRDDAGVDQTTALETFTTAGSLSITDVKRLALVTCYDRLHLITLSGSALLSVYTWSGSAFTLRKSLTVDQDIQGGIAACARGDNIYIGICDSVQNWVSFYRFSAVSFALGLVAEGALAVNQPGAISMASNGAMFVFLHEYDNGDGTHDVRLAYGGNLERLRQKSVSFLDMFDGDWTAQGNVEQPFICWSPTYKFIAMMRAGVDAPGKLRVARSPDGDDWSEFKDILEIINYPTVVDDYGNVKNVAVAPEGRRLFSIRGTAATLDDPPTDVAMQYFNGRTAWSAEIAAGTGSVLSGTGLGIANWRGTIWGAWATASGTIVLRKWNTLSTLPSSTPGYSSRAIEQGEPNFVDGPEDDTRTALFFEVRGDFQEDDVFVLPTAYDRRGANVLSEVLTESWRAALSGTPYIQLDAGVDRLFRPESLALFRTNAPSVLFELDDDDTFASPPTSVTIPATIRTAACTGGGGNFASFAAGTFRPHEFKSRVAWAQFVTGVTGIFRIVDNTDSELKLDGVVTGAGGTVTIFGDRIGYHFPVAPTPRRYARITLPDEELPDGFHEVCRLLFGQPYLATPRDYAVGWRTSTRTITSLLRLKSEAGLATPRNTYPQRSWQLRFPAADGDQVESLVGLFEGLAAGREQIAFWPEGSDEPNNVYLVRVDDEVEMRHRIGHRSDAEGEHHDVEVSLIEEV